MGTLITRKNFLIGSMATAALGARQLLAVPRGSVRGKPNLKVGVISDCHVEYHGTKQNLIDALEWYRDQGVDAVMIAGDIIDQGYIYELGYVKEAWKKVFPNNKLRNGKKVEKLFCFGNHCVADWGLQRIKDPNEQMRKLVICNPKKAFENAFDEAYEPIFTKTIKGYQFTGVHWPALGQREEWFAANGKNIDPTKPFFFFQHPHPSRTCHAPRMVWTDGGVATKLLAKYPNAIALSGHSHCPLTDERAVWQGEFTSIGTSSLFYTGGFTNFINANSRYNARATRQGMLFNIYDDFICIQRRCFVANDFLGDDWILPVGKGAAKPYEHARREKVAKAPEFKKGAAIKAEGYFGTPNKKGKMPTPELKLSWPAPVIKDKCRVLGYNVHVTFKADGEEKTLKLRVLSPDHHLVPSKIGCDGVCYIKATAFPKNATKVNFEVSPFEAFGKTGKSLRLKNVNVTKILS